MDQQKEPVDNDDILLRYKFDPDTHTTLSNAVVNAVATVHGAEPTELDPPLYRTVDPDALNSLFGASTEVEGRVEFTHNGYRVTVDTHGNITVNQA